MSKVSYVPDIQEAKCSEFAVQTLPLPLEAPSGGGCIGSEVAKNYNYNQM